MAFAVSDWLTVLCLSNTAPPLKFSGGAGVEGREIESLLRDDCPEFLLVKGNVAESTRNVQRTSKASGTAMWIGDG